jgi:hypothetical protein
MKVEESLNGQKYGTLKSINYNQMTSSFITIYKKMGIQNQRGSPPVSE